MAQNRCQKQPHRQNRAKDDAAMQLKGYLKTRFPQKAKFQVAF